MSDAGLGVSGDLEDVEVGLGLPKAAGPRRSRQGAGAVARNRPEAIARRRCRVRRPGEGWNRQSVGSATCCSCRTRASNLLGRAGGGELLDGCRISRTQSHPRRQGPRRSRTSHVCGDEPDMSRAAGRNPILTFVFDRNLNSRPTAGLSPTVSRRIRWGKHTHGGLRIGGPHDASDVIRPHPTIQSLPNPTYSGMRLPTPSTPPLFGAQLSGAPEWSPRPPGPKVSQNVVGHSNPHQPKVFDSGIGGCSTGSSCSMRTAAFVAAISQTMSSFTFSYP